MSITIREIARLAGVSPASVSRIINGKDRSISPATREKVLSIVKEYHYVPRQASLSNVRSYLIGVLLQPGRHNDDLAKYLTKYAEQNGYHVVLGYVDDTEDVSGRLDMLQKLCVDAAVVDVPELSVTDLDIPYINLANPGGACSYPELFTRLAQVATDELIDQHHSRIACIYRQGATGDMYVNACMQALTGSHSVVHPEDFIELSSVDDQLTHLMKHTAAICQDVSIAVKVYRRLRQQHHLIPRDFSLVAIADQEVLDEQMLEITSACYSAEVLAREIISYLVGATENRENTPSIQEVPVTILNRGSVQEPVIRTGPNILVAGSINMDVYVSVEEFPQDGTTVRAEPMRRIPGGKALNQAVTAARLGANVCLLGRVGNDDYGRLIYSEISKLTTQMTGIIVDDAVPTGSAYVLRKNDGESSVALYPGANRDLTDEEINQHTDLFQDIQLCLLQTELPVDRVLHIANLARHSGCKIILKPCDISHLPEELLQLADYLVLNEHELRAIVPRRRSDDRRIAALQQNYKGTIVLTRAERGCDVYAPQEQFHCTALKTEGVDAIGASDVFIGTFATFLGAGYTLRESIQNASCAAGFSITMQGVTSAVIDRHVLSALVEDHQLTISEIDNHVKSV